MVQPSKARPPQLPRSNLRTVISLLPYLWPAGNTGARIRVVIAVVFMLLAKVATVYVPIIYARIVDTLSPARIPRRWLLPCRSR